MGLSYGVCPLCHANDRCYSEICNDLAYFSLNCVFVFAAFGVPSISSSTKSGERERERVVRVGSGFAPGRLTYSVTERGRELCGSVAEIQTWPRRRLLPSVEPNDASSSSSSALSFSPAANIPTRRLVSHSPSHPSSRRPAREYSRSLVKHTASRGLIVPSFRSIASLTTRRRAFDAQTKEDEASERRRRVKTEIGP